MRNGHISLPLCDFAYITTFLCFQGEPSGFISKDSILGGLRRIIEVRGNLGTKNKAERTKQEGARPCAQEPPASATQKNGTATPCHCARVAVRPTHGHAWGCAPQIKFFSRFFFGGIFHSAFFFAFPLTFRVWERGLRESSNLDLALNLCFWIEDCEDSRIVLHSTVNLCKFVLLTFSLDFCFRVLIVLPCVFDWMLDFVF